ncbi:MAG: type I restriction-modification enzyme R subunit C-terminal domain-containing protein, partial [bacterium]|nr:type I restriction-modification enzyme R subunit C-terminal domain-containing protein [bacterium]
EEPPEEPPDGPWPLPPPPPREKIKIRLSDGSVRSIQHMESTSFWHENGTPMSAQQFLEHLYGKLPELFNDERHLRALWSKPNTRKELLNGLEAKGITGGQLVEMQKVIDAEDSDLFDVLAYVAFKVTPITRVERAAQASEMIYEHVESQLQTFLDFVLGQYVREGVYQLDKDQLAALLRLKYSDSIKDAVDALGSPDELSKAFTGFQQYLYQERPYVQAP